MTIDMDNKKLDGLKITYIGQASLDGAGTGGAARIKSMISIFKRLGIKTDLISYSYYSGKFGIEHKKIDHSLQTTTIHLPNNLPNFLKAFAIFPVFIYAWKSCKNSDIIFADFIIVLTSLPATMLGKIFNKPLILDYIDITTGNFIDTVMHIFKYVKNADVIFAISHHLYERAKSEYGCKNVVFVPIFIDPNHFEMDLKAREKIRKKLGIKDDDTVIGYVGSFWHGEGITFLLQAFKNLTKKYSKIKLAIMGKMRLSGSDDNIPKLVEDMNFKDDIILIPAQPHEEVPKFLSAFDILCCPKIDCEANRAANPVKVPEYLSMGLPAVCSAVGGITDTIEDGVDGLLVKPGDVKDLEEKLEWVILNPKRAKEIGANGRKTAIEKCSSKALQDTIEQAISDVIEGKGNKMGD